MNLSDEEKKLIKNFCNIFNAQRLWIDGVEVNVPVKKYLTTSTGHDNINQAIKQKTIGGHHNEYIPTQQIRVDASIPDLF